MTVRQGSYQARLWLAGNLAPGLAPRQVHPADASIKLTENCQARCVTCDYWKQRWTDHIGTDAAVRLISRLGEIGISTLRFTGGEPLLRKDFFDILGAIDPTPFTTIGVQTNGLLLRRQAGQINDSPITHVSVSIDAVGERNDAIRGVRGYFDRAMAGLRLLTGKTLIIAMTLTQAGADDIDEIISHVQELGGYLACNLPDNRLYFLQGADLASTWPDQVATDRIVGALASRLRPQFADYELDYVRRYLLAEGPTVTDLNPPCVLGYTTIYIASDGAVRAGCYVLPPLGNILEDDIGEILRCPAYLNRARSMLRLECPGCACNVFKSLRAQHAPHDHLARITRMGSQPGAGDRSGSQ